MISAIFPENFRPQFSGHETFPLRQLWLLKFSQLIHDIQNGVVGKPSDVFRSVKRRHLSPEKTTKITQP